MSERKKLLERLQPATKTPGLGKTVDCPRCNRPGAEHYSANYVACKWCDGPPTKAKSPTIEVYRSTANLGDWSDEEGDTNPGFGFTGNAPANPDPIPARSWYVCTNCNRAAVYDVDAVANGGVCMPCGGQLRTWP